MDAPHTQQCAWCDRTIVDCMIAPCRGRYLHRIHLVEGTEAHPKSGERYPVQPA